MIAHRHPRTAGYGTELSPRKMDFIMTPPSPFRKPHQSPYPSQKQLLSPPHSRQSSLTQLQQLKADPHRSIMGINNLITPPNSGEFEVVQSFQEDHSDTQSEHEDTIFPRHAHELHQPSPLFAETSIHHTSKGISIDQLEKVAKDWSRYDSPDWKSMERFGTHPAKGVRTWQDLEDREAARNNHITRPTQEEYLDVLHFLNGLKYGAAVPSVLRETSTNKRRKTLQDVGAKRRKISATPGLTDDKIPGAGARRRHSKVNGKVVGAEGRSARAPSTKEAKDPNWRNYPDYAPSFSDAPESVIKIAENAKQFDTKDNRKAPRDLANDPEHDELHPAELVVAQYLHLDCHRFLTSKRQIFQGYVNLLRKRHQVEQRISQGLEQRGETKVSNWNKTEAQKLLGIDVSKGSWIWQFYKDLGWFEPNAEHLYQQFLVMPEQDD